AARRSAARGAAARNGHALGDHPVSARPRAKAGLVARVRKWVSRNPTPVRYALLACSVASLVGGAVLIYYYVSYSRIIDARLHGERERTLPRVYARPLEVRRGETLTEQELVARLNDIGYAQRQAAAAPGEFAIDRSAVVITPRSGELSGKIVR